LGAWKDRKGLPLRAQEAVDGARSPPAHASRSRRFDIGRALRWLLLAILWIVPPLVGLFLLDAYQSSDHFRRTVSGSRDVAVIRASTEYVFWLLRREIPRQTVALPPVNRAEVIAFGEVPDGTVGEPFPVFLGGSVHFDRAVHCRATLRGHQAEALAQIWRSRSFAELGFSGGRKPMYSLRFFSRGRLVMEAEMVWRNERVDFVEFGALIEGFTDKNEEILTCLQEIAPLPDGRKAEIACNHGSAAFSERDYERALEEFNRAIQLAPKDTRARREKVKLYLEIGEYDKAMEECDTLVRIEPQNHEMYALRADVDIASGDLREAVEDYTRALQQCQRARLWEMAVAYLFARGLTHDKLGDLQQAIDDLSRAIRLDTDRGSQFSPGELLDARARLYEKLGDLPRALADLDAAFELHEQWSDEFGMMAPFPGIEDSPREAGDEPAPEDTGVPGWPGVLSDGLLDPGVSIAGESVDPVLAHRYVRRARIRAALGDHEGARVDLYIVEQAGFDPDSDEWHPPAQVPGLLP
jgi:tetratricopeptide (TPR) repeat protein